MSQRPLSGIRVIDFGQYVAGPAAAMMLGDLGAEVIRIDPPGGPRWDSPAADMLNRGKLCAELDLKTEGGVAEAKRLIRSADVVIENFRPGVMARLGLDAETVHADNPGLVYLSLPGFSSRDPDRATLRAWEAIVAAACGQYSDMGLNRVLMGVEPSFSPLPLASAYAAVLGAGAVALALAAREEHGHGDRIEVPLASALMEGLAYNAMNLEDYPERYKSNREKEIDRRRAAGEPMNVAYDDLQELLDPFYRNYACKDGRRIYIVSASHIKHPERVMRALGIWDELVAEGLPLHDGYLDIADLPDGDDCTLHSYPLSQAWADRVSGLMKKAFREKAAFEWERILGKAGAPAAAQRTTAEWLQSEHALASGLILNVEDPDHGVMRQLGNLSWLASDADEAVKKAPRREVNAASLPAKPKPATLSADHPGGGWLDGIKIVDLTNVIAGPTIAATLARHGADVTWIGSVKPSMDPWNGIIFAMQAGRGKRNMLLDLKSDSGREALDLLLGDADIVTCNAMDKQLTGLGLDPDRLKRINPRLILCQLDCYGGPMRGPRSDYPGYDDLAQASTGVMARFGGSLETPEEHAHFGTIDVLGGFAAIIGIGAALRQRAILGHGDRVRASLAAAGQMIQAPFMMDFDGRGPFDEPSGREAKGSGPLYRAYAASDGFFFLAANGPDDRGRLVEVLGIDGNPRAEALSSLFKSKPTTHWVKLLGARDIAAHRLDKMHAVRDAHLIAEAGEPPDLLGPTFSFIRHDPHPSGRFVDLVAPNAVRPRHASLRVPAPFKKPGTDTETILSELGFEPRRIAAMLENGEAANQWSEKYLPE